MTKGTKEWANRNVNFSKGCSNGCQYCYAKRMANRFGWKKTEEWTTMENKEEMKDKKFRKQEGWIMSPSSHDITNENVDLGISVFKNILASSNNLLIVSKPSLEIIKRICKELEEWKSQILFRFTIGTLNDNIRAYWEPNSPPIKERINSLKYAFENNWNTSVSVEPFLDDKIVPLIEKIHPHVTDTIWIGPMNKTHVPKELWTEKEKKLYSSQSLKELYEKLNKLKNQKIVYKDHFYNIINKKSISST